MNRVVALVMSLLAKSKDDKQSVNIKNRGDEKSVSLENANDGTQAVIAIVTLLVVDPCKAVCVVVIFECYMRSTHVLPLVAALREQMTQTANAMSNHAAHAAHAINTQTTQAFSTVNNTMNSQISQANNAIYTIRTKSGDIPLNGPIGSIVGLGICKCHKIPPMYEHGLMICYSGSKKGSFSIQ